MEHEIKSRSLGVECRGSRATLGPLRRGFANALSTSAIAHERNVDPSVAVLAQFPFTFWCINEVATWLRS